MSIRSTHLLVAGAFGPAVFVLGYLINGALQAGYASSHDTISALSLAPHGWIQNSNFVVYGILTVLFAEGLRRTASLRTAGYLALLVAAAGLIVIGFFPTDPVLGFPESAPTVVTATGGIHNLGALVVFTAFPVAALTTVTRRSHLWSVFSIATAVFSIAAVGAFFAAVESTPAGAQSSAGFYERLPTLFIGLWQLVFVYRALTRNR
ncbi:DUF998 domain-containing protein [Nocardia sp. NPDC003979]